MSITLYDLCGADQDIRFSPFCWRAKMALAHKGVTYDGVPTPFTKIPEIEGGATKTVPFVVDGDTKIGGSFQIALYLEERYPDAPTLFGGETGIAHARFVEGFANTVLMGGFAQQVVKNVYDRLDEVDQVYFRESREKRFGTTLEALHEAREGKRDALKASLNPLRMMLASQPFIGGESPLYSDYICFGPFKWASLVSDVPLLADDDPVKTWFDAIDGRHNAL
ncbi:MAG: glutathione S-transferase family protein [Pseudomonadota bacterium]